MSITNTQTQILQNYEQQFFSKKEATQYNHWRVRILYSCIIGYATYYLTRQNFSMVVPILKEEYGYSNAAFGSIFTMFSIVYGVGKLLNGFFSDKLDARYFLSIGLFLSAIVTFCCGFVSGLAAFGFLLLLNGWFQSMGWPPIARMLCHWFSPKEMGTKYSYANTSQHIGAAILPLLSAFLIAHYGWRYSFFVPGVIAIFVAVFLINRLRDNPTQLNLPSIEVYKNCVPKGTIIDESRITFKEACNILIKTRVIWYIGCADFFLYVVRMGIFNWAPEFLKSFKGLDISTASWQIAAFAIAGLLGSISAGWISDNIFSSRRGPVATIYMLMMVIALLVFWKLPSTSLFLNTFTLVLIGFLVSGPQLLVGVAMADFASKRAVGVANGAVNLLAALGTAFSGVGIGWISDRWGWDGGFLFFTISALLGAFFWSLVWNKRAKVLDDFK